jgi:hypothetical protein
MLPEAAARFLEVPVRCEATGEEHGRLEPRYADGDLVKLDQGRLLAHHGAAPSAPPPDFPKKIGPVVAILVKVGQISSAEGVALVEVGGIARSNTGSNCTQGVGGFASLAGIFTGAC